MPRNVFIQLSLIPLPQRQSAFLVGSQSPASEGSLLRGAVGVCSLCRAGAGLVGADHNQEPNISCHTCVHPAARHMVAAELVPHKERRSLKADSKHLEPPIQIFTLYNLSTSALFFNCG